MGNVEEKTRIIDVVLNFHKLRNLETLISSAAKSHATIFKSKLIPRVSTFTSKCYLAVFSQSRDQRDGEHLEDWIEEIRLSGYWPIE